MPDENMSLAPEQVAERLRTAMSTPPPWWPELRLSAEVKVGDTWMEGH